MAVDAILSMVVAGFETFGAEREADCKTSVLVTALLNFDVLMNFLPDFVVRIDTHHVM